ncbi:hypothetical protein ASA1KI_23730 [Opitutales bacterium ASA1]|jgi:hypothetical protein|uniref:SirB2 family protein n=1 Tax=Congregicoccus parvus TaxID=3081749 RepID=UPI002B2B6898|nr:hypothetical protein ASA1KI_23730 [Opitutales bacterium ASA1]
MSPLFYQILHVGGVILLFGLTFSAFADPRPERKKKLLMVTGILSLVVLVAAFGLISKLHGNNFTGWMIAKIVIWLAVAAFSGIVFRRPGKAKLFAWLTAVLGVLAVYLVYARPVIFGF